ncbi:glutathione S-transferase family protein [Sphingopyxis sp. MSC1_008]|jgi:glutathione S-transferase|uniref:glutathione S-transferase family protein n=1 Tax=Sphingopyxis sp. MSC1_008 TaxID=2909265 RepID=UPI0020BF2A62|nr:glutathione S-transferase family protein [Sphingopyxis sp. MSC1_008]
MITLYGEGRGFRVAWLLEEMGLPYRLRQVDLLDGVEQDTEFLSINPAGFIPAIVDGDTVMVESIAIMEYLLARYGPSPLVPTPDDAAFATYQQFLHMGEAGLAGPVNAIVATNILAPEDERKNWTAGWALGTFESRLGLVTRQLTGTPYIAGDRFTAADISVTYALEFAQRTINYALGGAEKSYIARTTARQGYARAMDNCPATKAWIAAIAGSNAT